MHDEFIDTNTKFNVCYGLPTYELFQKIEGDEIIGKILYNSQTVTIKVKMYDKLKLELKELPSIIYKAKLQAYKTLLDNLFYSFKESFITCKCVYCIADFAYAEQLDNNTILFIHSIT